MKLLDLLYEGRYDRLTGILTKEVFKYLKDTAGKSSYKGQQIQYDERPSFSPDESNIIGNFSDSTSDIEVDLSISVARVKSMKNKFYVTGYALTDEGVLVIHIYMGTEVEEPKVYSNLLPHIKSTIRHEIEHLTQRGWNVNPSKKRKFMWAARAEYKLDTTKSWKYYTLADEVDANLHGIYAIAKAAKIPFQDAVYSFLDELMSSGKVTYEQSRTIYNKMKQRAKKISGFPPLS